MGKADVDSVCKNMRLAMGLSGASLFFLTSRKRRSPSYDLKVGNSVLLTYGGNPMAILEVEEIFDYDKKAMCQAVYGTDDAKHPGCARIYDYKDKFIGGKVTLVNRPENQRAVRSVFHSAA